MAARILPDHTSMMSGAYPLHLSLAGRRVVVVGGGPVAARRVAGCLDAQADVLVVAPELCADLAALAGSERITWVPRDYREGDLAGAWLVHTATGDPAVDAAVDSAAKAQRLWCVRADDAAASSARTPAVVRRDDVVVSVAASATPDPRRSAALRDAIGLALDTGGLPLRRKRRGPGIVSLVGAGPGDPQLMTLRARRLLAAADVVVVDRLAPTSILDELDPDVAVIDVGKSPDHHPVPQEEINALLVDHARAGHRVVRLKGGDPYVLGRGGEELAACRAAGVEVEVVPGITSAFAVPAAAGIPVTHRGLSKQVTVLSGHEDADWATLARLDGTLIVLMGVATLGSITAGLIAGGRDPHTPVAVVERGYAPDQRTTRATLEAIAARARERGVRSPAVVVIGEVAALAQETGPG